MPIQVIISQAGPLPISVNFSAPGDEPMYLEVSGSVWSQSSNEMLGIVVAIDGNELGVAQIFSNGNTTHRAVVPAYIQVQLSEGQHSLTLAAADNTVSDSNDLFAAVLHF